MLKVEVDMRLILTHWKSETILPQKKLPMYYSKLKTAYEKQVIVVHCNKLIWKLQTFRQHRGAVSIVDASVTNSAEDN
jgi:hypothetical protein